MVLGIDASVNRSLVKRAELSERKVLKTEIYDICTRNGYSRRRRILIKIDLSILNEPAHSTVPQLFEANNSIANNEFNLYGYELLSCVVRNQSA